MVTATRASKKTVFAAILLFLSISFTNCGTNSGNANQLGQTPQLGGTASQLADGLHGLGNALASSQTGDPAADGAQNAAANALNDLADLYSKMQNGMSPQDLLNALANRLQVMQELDAAREAARQAGLAWLEATLAEILNRQDVFRFFNGGAGGKMRHIFITPDSLSAAQGALQGFHLEGRAFGVYKKPQPLGVDSDGNTITADQPLYSQYVPSWNNYYISATSTAEVAGFCQVLGVLGYVSAKQTNGTPKPLTRLFLNQGANGGDHCYSTDDADNQNSEQAGYVVEGQIGFPPP
jgi:hypothetical protein